MAFTEREVQFETIKPGWHEGVHDGCKIILAWERLGGGWNVHVYSKPDSKYNGSIDDENNIGEFHMQSRPSAVIRAKELIAQWHNEAIS